jgi:hypothetical protein
METVVSLAQELYQSGGEVLRSTIERELDRIGPVDALIGKTSTEARQQVVGSFVRLLEPRLTEGGGFQFRVTGDAMSALRAEYSNDLVNWVPLEGGVLQALPATVQDLNPVTNTPRYYRVVQAP